MRENEDFDCFIELPATLNPQATGELLTMNTRSMTHRSYLNDRRRARKNPNGEIDSLFELEHDKHLSRYFSTIFLSRSSEKKRKTRKYSSKLISLHFNFVDDPRKFIHERTNETKKKEEIKSYLIQIELQRIFIIRLFSSSSVPFTLGFVLLLFFTAPLSPRQKPKIK